MTEQLRPSVQFTIGAPEGRRFSTSGGLMEIPPDGKHLALVATDANGSASLWLRPLGNLPSFGRLTDYGFRPVLSPIARRIGFLSERRLKAVDVASGAVRVIASIPTRALMEEPGTAPHQILVQCTRRRDINAGAGVCGAPQRLTLALDTRCKGCAAWPFLT